MTSIKVPSDASINVQNAFRDVDRAVRELAQRIDNLGQSVTPGEMVELRKEINRLLKNPTYRAWVDVFGTNLANTTSTRKFLLSQGLGFIPEWAVIGASDLGRGSAVRGDIWTVTLGGIGIFLNKSPAGWVLGYDSDDVVGLDRRVVKTTNDFSTTSGTLVDVTDLAFSVEANADYDFEFEMATQSSGAGLGLKLSLNGPASPTRISFSTRIQTTTQQTFHNEGSRAYDAATITAGVDTANANCPATLRGNLRNGSNAGTLIVRLCGGGINTVRVMAGAGGWIHKL